MSVAGTPEECVAKLRSEIADAGVNHIILAITDAALVKALMGRDLDNVSTVDDQLQLFHDEVMPAFAATPGARDSEREAPRRPG